MIPQTTAARRVGFLGLQPAYLRRLGKVAPAMSLKNTSFVRNVHCLWALSEGRHSVRAAACLPPCRQPAVHDSPRPAVYVLAGRTFKILECLNVKVKTRFAQVQCASHRLLQIVRI